MNSSTIIITLLLLSATSVSALAEELPDPTRPPLEIGAYTGSRAHGRAGIGEAAQKGLQSVIISPDRRTAIISGHTVELGEKFGDAQLTEVNESGVTLSGPRGKQKLLLMFPAVEIRKKESPSSTQPDDTKMNATEKQAVGNAASGAAAQGGK